MLLSILSRFRAGQVIIEVQDCIKHANHSIVNGLVLPNVLEAALGECQQIQQGSICGQRGTSQM